MFEYFAFVFTRSSGKKKERKVSIIVFCLGMMTKHHKSPNVGVSDMRINLQQLLQYFSYDYNKPIFMFAGCEAKLSFFKKNNVFY